MFNIKSWLTARNKKIEAQKIAARNSPAGISLRASRAAAKVLRDPKQSKKYKVEHGIAMTQRK